MYLRTLVLLLISPTLINVANAGFTYSPAEDASYKAATRIVLVEWAHMYLNEYLETEKDINGLRDACETDELLDADDENIDLACEVLDREVG